MRREYVVESDNDIKHDICIEVLEEYLNAFKMSEKAMRTLPASLTRKERTELIIKKWLEI